MSQETHPSSAPGSAPPTQRRSGPERARLVVAFLLGALAVLFAVLNLEEVDVHWIVAVWRTPLIIVIVVSLLVGAVIGFIFGRRRG